MTCIVLYAINKTVSTCPSFKCLIQKLVRWYPDVIGHSIRVAIFYRDPSPAGRTPEFHIAPVSPGVAIKGDWLNLAYFNVAKMYMPIMHCYRDDFYPPARGRKRSRREQDAPPASSIVGGL